VSLPRQELYELDYETICHYEDRAPRGALLHRSDDESLDERTAATLRDQARRALADSA
jgi:hypothetical protein